MQGIYKITNLVNNKVYIGKTNNSERRWADHQRLAFTLNHKEYEKALYKAMRKYGLDNFIFEIIEELKDYSISEEREQYWINYYNSYNNGYNETLGGDGGSPKGHCLGELNGKAKLNKEDVILIRTKYAEGISKNECYELVKNKITKNGFAKVWLGQTWKDIMPEVFTEENKKRNTSLGRSAGAKTKRLLSNEDVLNIRNLKKKGESLKNIYLLYQDKVSKSCIDDIYYNRTYKEVQ